MFDQVPVQIWLLIAIAAIAFTPAKYTYRHIAHSPSRRDITQPTEDLSWRTSAQFVRNLTMLAALLGFAIFIFTPTAEQFARSPHFLPILMAAVGGWAILTVVQGFATGRIQPFMKGFNNTYERNADPTHYWASMGWNSLLGALLMWSAYESDKDASAEVAAAGCAFQTDAYVPERKLASCDELIRLRPDDVDAYVSRGLVFLDTGAFDQANRDFSRAHDLDPKSPWPLANRGIVAAWNKNRAGAEKDFAAVRSIDPSNPVMLRGEALLRKDAGDLVGAVDRLTASMVRDPDNLWAVRTRSEWYWELGEHEKSREDDQRWVRLSEAARTQRLR